MKIIRQILSLLLFASVLLLSSCGIPLNRDEETELRIYAKTVAADDVHSLLVLGDSIAAHYGVSEEESYEAKLTHKLTARGETWVSTNWGVSGYTTGDLVTLLRQKRENASARKILSEADLICISIGGNNILEFVRRAGYEGFPTATLANIRKLLKAFEDEAEPMKVEFLADLEVIMKEIKALSPHATILIQNIHNVARDVEGNFPLFGETATAASLLEPVFAPLLKLLDENAERLGYTVADTYSAFRDCPEKRLLRREMLHPNPKGHTLIAEVLYDTYLKTQNKA